MGLRVDETGAFSVSEFVELGGKDSGLDDLAILEAVQKHMIKDRSPVTLRSGTNQVNGKYMVRGLVCGKYRSRS